MSGDYIGSDLILAPVTVTVTSTSNVSSAAIDVLGSGDAGFFYFSVTGADAYIVFGNLSTMSAATTSNGFPLSAGSREPFYLTQATRYFRVITASGTGTVVHYRSGP
jgi:hypothetical protein